MSDKFYVLFRSIVCKYGVSCKVQGACILYSKCYQKLIQDVGWHHIYIGQKNFQKWQVAFKLRWHLSYDKINTV